MNLYLRNLKEQKTELSLLCADAIEPPPTLKPSAWSRKNLYLSPECGTPRPGLFHPEPYQAAVMDEFLTRKHILCCWGAQIGKSAMLQALYAYVVDNDPGPAMFVYPDQNVCKRRSKTHLRSMFDSSPALKTHTTGNPDDLSIYFYKLDRMITNIVHAGSPSALSAETVRYLFRDEIGKFVGSSDKEADALSLSARRVITFGALARIFDTSTPTIKTMEPWVTFINGTASLWHVPCCKCGEFQAIEFEDFVYPKEKPNESKDAYFKRVKRDTRIQCKKCNYRINDNELLRMTLKGKLVHTNPDAEVFSTRIPSWYSPIVKIGDVAVRFLVGKYNADKMRDVVNSDFALPYESVSGAVDKNILRNHGRKYRLKTIPTDEKCILIMTADLHKHFQRYLVRAHTAKGSYLVDYGSVRTLEDIKSIKDSMKYKTTDGNSIYQISAAFVDSQYSPEPEAVFKWAKSDDTVYAITGKGTAILSVSHPAGFKDIDLFNFNEVHFKDRLLDAMNSGHNPETLEYSHELDTWLIPENVSEKYLTELLAEEPVEEKNQRTGETKRIWKEKSSENHYFDLEKYQCCARYTIEENLEALDAPEENPAVVPVEQPKDW